MRPILYAVFICALFFLGCGPAEPPGTLEGHVTIGPLCPVEPCTVPPERVTEAYASRTIVVYNEVNVLVKELTLDSAGYYHTELAPGQYVVDVRKSGIDRSIGVPKTIIIESGKSVKIDVDIDTGIR